MIILNICVSGANAGILNDLFSAAKEHPSVISAKKSSEAAASDLRAAEWLRYPSLSLEAKKNLSEPDQISLRLEQPIKDGGYIDGAIQEAAIKNQIAEVKVWEAEQKIRKDIASGYLGILKYQQLLKISETNKNSLQNLLRRLSLRVKQKISPRTELDMIKARLSQAQSESFRLQGELARTKELLSEAASQVVEKVNELDCNIPSGIGSEDFLWIASERSPELRLSNLERDQSLNDLGKIKSELFPKFSIGYENTRDSGFHSAPSSTIYFSLKYQLSNGLSLFNKIDSAGARMMASDNRVNEQQKELKKQINSLWEQYQYSFNMIEPLSSLIKTNSSQIQSYLVQHTVGKKSWVDVMNIQREYIQSKLSLAETSNLLCSSALNLQLLTGIQLVDERATNAR